MIKYIQVPRSHALEEGWRPPRRSPPHLGARRCRGRCWWGRPRRFGSAVSHHTAKWLWARRGRQRAAVWSGRRSGTPGSSTWWRCHAWERDDSPDRGGCHRWPATAQWWRSLGCSASWVRRHRVRLPERMSPGSTGRRASGSSDGTIFKIIILNVTNDGRNLRKDRSCRDPVSSCW